MNQIYFHDITNSVPLHQHPYVPGLGLYGCRALAVSNPGDSVIMPQAATEGLSAIERHYQDVGLRHGVSYAFGGWESLVRRPPSFEPSLYEYNRHSHQLFRDLRWLPTVELLGDKNYFVDHCENLGLSFPATTKVRFRCDCPSPERYPVVVKPVRSVVGGGATVCASRQQYEQVVGRLDLPYQVQEYLPTTTRYFVVEYRRTGGRLLPGVVVERVSRHGRPVSYHSSGSVAPRITMVTDRLAVWAFEQGMKGMWSYEVAVTPTGAVLPLECRPRWSDVSYSIVVAEKLGVTEWECQTFTGLTLAVSDVCELGELMYQPRAKEGVVIINWATVSQGRLDVLVAGEPAARAELLSELSYRLRSRTTLASA